MTDAINKKYQTQRAHGEELQLPVPVYESEYYVREAQCGNLDMPSVMVIMVIMSIKK